MAGEGLNVRGPCSSCRAQLATDQRYCIECGQRVGPPLALPYSLPPAAPEQPDGGWMAALPVPMQMASMFAAVALGFGVVVGTAISPDLAGIVAAPGPVVATEQPPAVPPAATGGGGGAASGGGGGPMTIASTPPASSSGGGGGGREKPKKRRKKKQPAQQTLSGTVVHVNPVAGSYAISAGSLLAIHADSPPILGQQLEVPVRRLANGTYTEIGERNETGMTDSVSFSGTVTYCADLEQPAAACDGSSANDHYAYAVSGVGASVLVSAPFPAPAPPPEVGSLVDVTAKLGDPFQPIAPASWLSDASCTPPYDESSGLPADSGKQPALVEQSVNVTGPTTNATVEAVVQTVCPGDAPKLVLSADDIREGGRDLAALPVPGGIDLARLTPGQAVQAAVAIADDGKVSLQGISSDQGAAGADDPAQGQGSLTGS